MSEIDDRRGAGGLEGLLSSVAGRRAAILRAAIAVATVIAAIALWPGESTEVGFGGIAGDSEEAEVVRYEELPCPGAEAESCASVEAELAAEPGTAVEVELGSTEFAPELEVGDRIRVTATEAAPGASPTYTFADFERRGPMLWLAIGFAVIVVAFGRLRGGLSLAGLLASLAVILLYVVPAIRDGAEPVLIAIVGAIAVMLITISLAHGLGAKSAAAMLGTAASLLLVAGLALAFTELAHLTGFGSEEATLLAGSSPISIEGLLLAGMVIGALGVLDDVTVSQASTVLALRGANPGLGGRELYRRSIDVGRDHVSATVNTLVLAYVGASLPVLLIFSSSGVGFGEAINSEIVATEIVAMLAGSIGLIAAVPLTTAIATALAVRLPPESAAASGEAHSH